MFVLCPNVVVISGEVCCKIVVDILRLVVLNVGDCVDETLYEVDTIFLVDDLNSVDILGFVLFKLEVVILVDTFCVDTLVVVWLGFWWVVIFEVVISLVVIVLLCTEGDFVTVVNVGTVFLLFEIVKFPGS